MHTPSVDNHLFIPSTCEISPKIIPLKEACASDGPGLLRSKKKKKFKKHVPAIKIQNIETPHEGMLKESNATNNHGMLNTNKSSTPQLPSVAAAPLTKKHIPKV